MVRAVRRCVVAGGGERGSVGLEVLVVTPLLATLVLFVVWAGNSGRSGLVAGLAVEEAAVAAAQVCAGDGGVDAGCAESVAGQVLANRVLPGTLCEPSSPPPRSLSSDSGAGSSGGGVVDVREGAVVVSVDCGIGHGGEQFVSGLPDSSRRFTGMHLLGTPVEIPEYTGDRPTEPSICAWPDNVEPEPFPQPPIARQPGNVTRAMIDRVKIRTDYTDYTHTLYVRCFEIETHREQYRQSPDDIILKVWTLDNRNPGLRSAAGGDTCHDFENTGVEYLQIPEQFPQYLRIVPGEPWTNLERLSFPAGVCKAAGDRPLGGVFELHVEIVSGGTGHKFFYCDGRFCEEAEETRSRGSTRQRFMDCNGVSPPQWISQSPLLWSSRCRSYPTPVST